MNVLVMRPDERGLALVDRLIEHNIMAIHLPLFSIEAGLDLSQFPSAMARLNSGDYVFVVSKHAIDFATQTLAQTGFQWRSDLVYFAVGKHSAQHFSAQSAQPIHYPIQFENSEGLLALPEMTKEALNGKKLLILRAESGRELLSEQIALRGAEVQILECYRRVAKDINFAEQASFCKRAGIDTLVVTSSEILTTLIEQIPEAEEAWLLNCRLVVVSQRIAELAYQLGWNEESVIVSNKADNTNLLTTLLAIKS